MKKFKKHKRQPHSSLRHWNRNETKVAEEYS